MPKSTFPSVLLHMPPGHLILGLTSTFCEKKYLSRDGEEVEAKKLEIFSLPLLHHRASSSKIVMNMSHSEFSERRINPVLHVLFEGEGEKSEIFLLLLQTKHVKRDLSFMVKSLGRLIFITILDMHLGEKHT